MDFDDPMPTVTQISDVVKEAANHAGFNLAGIAPVREFDELEYFPEWIAAGNAGEMTYMEARDAQGHLKRASLKNAAPWARSVIVCAINYNTAEPYSTQQNDPQHGWISRYAWGREDYHHAVLRRLRLVEANLREAVTANQHGLPSENHSADHWPLLTDHFQSRCYVDTGPLVERVYAKYAGVGWIGKNTCVINPTLGSWLFLGEIICSLSLEPDAPAFDRCGSSGEARKPP